MGVGHYLHKQGTHLTLFFAFIHTNFGQKQQKNLLKQNKLHGIIKYFRMGFSLALGALPDIYLQDIVDGKGHFNVVQHICLNISCLVVLYKLIFIV